MQKPFSMFFPVGPMHVQRILFAALGAAWLLASSAHAVSFSKEIGRHEYYAEADNPYYFCSGIYCALSKTGIPTLDTLDEWPIYKNLLTNWYAPNCFVLEAGVAPLPLLGVAAKSWAPRYYARARVGGINLINTMTESVDFKEPGALSAFFGRMLYFKNSTSTLKGTATLGLLSSYGNYHIKDNSLLPDHWGEFEIKLKVDKKGTERRYATSYRLGTRLHSRADIRDKFYISLNRNRTDFSDQGFSLIRNTNAQVRCDLSYQPLQVQSVFVEAGKKFPIRIKKHAYAFGLSLGLAWNVHSAYTGNLAQGFVPNSFSPVIRPLITF